MVPLFQIATADPGVIAQLGTNPVRLFPFGEAPERVARPYAVWQTITGRPENYLAGRPDIDAYTIQVDVYADTGSAVRAAATAIRDAIELSAHIVRWSEPPKDPSTGRYRVSFDVSWLVPR